MSEERGTYGPKRTAADPFWENSAEKLLRNLRDNPDGLLQFVVERASVEDLQKLAAGDWLLCSHNTLASTRAVLLARIERLS